MPQCWLSNWMAHSQQDFKVQPEVFVLMLFSLSHFSLVTCFATREWVDLMTGNSPDMLGLLDLKGYYN